MDRGKRKSFRTELAGWKQMTIPRQHDSEHRKEAAIWRRGGPRASAKPSGYGLLHHCVNRPVSDRQKPAGPGPGGPRNSLDPDFDQPLFCFDPIICCFATKSERTTADLFAETLPFLLRRPEAMTNLFSCGCFALIEAPRMTQAFSAALPLWWVMVGLVWRTLTDLCH
ncbi:hypothetical protein VTI28DRAFT_9563 [Corynascus sepedonium]